MSAPKLTLILMHDDGKTHRLRISRKFFLFLTVLLLLLPILGGLGIWTGWEAWTAWQSFDQERGKMQSELDDWRMRAERLGNIVKLAGLPLPPDGGPPPVMTSSSTSSPVVAVADAPRENKASVNATSEVMAATNATSPTTPASSSTNSTQPPSAELPAAPAAPAEASPSSDPRDDEENNLDHQVVRLENVVSRVQGGRKLRITFDLYNAKPMAGQVGGKFTISLIDSNGKILPLEHDDGTFRISRFKKVALQAALPDSVTAADNAALLISVVVDDETVLQKIYQVESR